MMVSFWTFMRPASSAISRLVLILRPSSTIFFPSSSQIMMIRIMRSNCDAKVPTMSRPFTSRMICSMLVWTRISGIEKPLRSALVESPMKRMFLSFPRPPHTRCSFSEGISPSCSSLRSPEITTLPCLVSTEIPIESGIE